MKYGKYRERDRSAALKKVRADLGPNAVILHEQRIRTGLFGLFGTPLVEILAAVEEADTPTPAPASLADGLGGASGVQSSISAAARRAAAAMADAAAAGPEQPPPAPHIQPPRWSAPGALAGPTPEGASRLAAILEEFPKKGEQIPPAMAASLADLIAQAAVPVQPESRARTTGEPQDRDEREEAGATAPAAATAEAAATKPAAERVDAAAAPPEVPLPTASEGNTGAAALALDPSPALRDVQQTLLELRSAVDRLARQSHDSQVAAETPAVRAIYQQLSAREVEPTLALELVGQLSEEIGPSHDPGAHLVRGRLLEMLEERLPVAALGPGEGAPRVIVLTGPTGVGKTTTVAKLAAHLALDEGKTVCLVTTDTFRIAATGQLGTYAGIMDLPFEVAYTPDEFAGAIARHGDADFILVDTPGCAPRNQGQIKELARFVAAAPQALTLLTVAAPAKFRDLVETEAAFGVVPHGGLILTKLDETSAHGPVLSLVARSGRPVYFITAGQDVPRDIEVPAPARLATMLLDGLPEGDAAPEDTPPQDATPEAAAPGADQGDASGAATTEAA
jgi:flagellar biosynthesis protein FlhF